MSQAQSKRPLETSRLWGWADGWFTSDDPWFPDDGVYMGEFRRAREEKARLRNHAQTCQCGHHRNDHVLPGGACRWSYNCDCAAFNPSPQPPDLAKEVGTGEP